MTSSIPDGISFSDLEKLSAAAQSEDVPQEQAPAPQNLSEEELKDLVEAAFDKSMELCGNPLFHKLLIMRMSYHFVEWHTSVGQKMFAEGEEAAGTCWLRDAGKFQALGDIIASINLGPDDFITPTK